LTVFAFVSAWMIELLYFVMGAVAIEVAVLFETWNMTVFIEIRSTSIFVVVIV